MQAENLKLQSESVRSTKIYQRSHQGIIHQDSRSIFVQNAALLRFHWFVLISCPQPLPCWPVPRRQRRKSGAAKREFQPFGVFGVFLFWRPAVCLPALKPGYVSLESNRDEHSKPVWTALPAITFRAHFLSLWSYKEVFSQSLCCNDKLFIEFTQQNPSKQIMCSTLFKALLYEAHFSWFKGSYPETRCHLNAECWWSPPKTPLDAPYLISSIQMIGQIYPIPVQQTLG